MKLSKCRGKGALLIWCRCTVHQRTTIHENDQERSLSSRLGFSRQPESCLDDMRIGKKQKTGDVAGSVNILRRGIARTNFNVGYRAGRAARLTPLCSPTQSDSNPEPLAFPLALRLAPICARCGGKNPFVFADFSRRPKSALYIPDRPVSQRSSLRLRLVTRRRTSFRSHCGSMVHRHQRPKTRIPITSIPAWNSGRVTSWRRIVITMRIDKPASKTPATRRMREAIRRHTQETFGCGSESSRLPHWEQTFAIRGFG